MKLITSEKLSKLLDDVLNDVGDFELIGCACDYISLPRDDCRFTIIREVSELFIKAFNNNSNVYFALVHDYGIYVIAKDEQDLEKKVTSWRWE